MDLTPPYGICPGCGAENQAADRLGRIWHFLCRDCGLWYHKKETE